MPKCASETKVRHLYPENKQLNLNEPRLKLLIPECRSHLSCNSRASVLHQASVCTEQLEWTSSLSFQRSDNGHLRVRRCTKNSRITPSFKWTTTVSSCLISWLLSLKLAKLWRIFFLAPLVTWRCSNCWSVRAIISSYDISWNILVYLWSRRPFNQIGTSKHYR